MRKLGGFTVIELIVVTVVTALLSAVLLQFFVSYMRFGSIVYADSAAFVERLNASDYLRSNLGLSSGLITQTGINDDHALVPDSVDPQHWRSLYPVSGTFGNTSSVTPLLYFKKLSKSTSGALIFNGTTPYQDEFVLYHDGVNQQLRVRVLANTNASNNSRRTTCPDAVASATCPADLTLINGITSVKLRYFSRAGNELSVVTHDTSGVSPCLTPTYPYATCDGASYDIVEVVELTINLAKKPQGAPSASTKSATVIRVALRNK